MNWSIVNTVVGVIQIIVSIVLIASVLMQSAKKEGLSGVVGGASETFFGKNKGRTLDATFAVITTVCAIVFLVSSLFLSYGMIAVENAENRKASEQQTQEIDTEAGEAVEIETEDIEAEQDAESGDEDTAETEEIEETEETDNSEE